MGREQGDVGISAAATCTKWGTECAGAMGTQGHGKAGGLVSLPWLRFPVPPAVFSGIVRGTRLCAFSQCIWRFGKAGEVCFSANLHLTRCKLSLRWSSLSVLYSLQAEGISGGSQELSQSKGVSSCAHHMRGQAGEHLQQSLSC